MLAETELACATNNQDGLNSCLCSNMILFNYS